LMDGGVKVPAGDSPIVPAILGDEHQATDAAKGLLSAGIFVTAIRPPTVALRSSRLRFALSCDHTDAQIDHLVASVLKVCANRVPT
jgi:8-amino-7-oxononanoate synthase